MRGFPLQLPPPLRKALTQCGWDEEQTERDGTKGKYMDLLGHAKMSCIELSYLVRSIIEVV